jgi:hypothetical protein
VNPVPRWRIAAALAVLAALVFFAAVFAPIYFHNLELQKFVSTIPQRASSGAPPSDDVLRTWVLDKARQLELPVMPGDVRIFRSPDGARLERIDVHYFVKVDLPGYTVNLHFYPGAGSR